MVRAALAGLAAAILAAGCRSLEQEAIDVSHNMLLSGAGKDVQNKRYHAAINKLEKAAALKPDHAASHFRLGNVLVLRARDPEVNEEAFRNFVSRALTHHLKALELAPEIAQVHYYVGQDLILLGRPAEAIAYLEKAQELDPHAPFIDARLGDAYRLMKEFDLAETHYRAGLAKPPKALATMELHEGLAETFAAQGRTDEALQELELARKSATSPDHLKRLEKRIQELKGPPAPQ